MERQFDVVVIGTGPGGEGAAMQASKLGKSVLVVERYHQVGGGCTHWGTIPSKALRHAIQQFGDFRHHALVRAVMPQVPVDVPALLRSAGSVITQQVEMRHDFYERNRIELMTGVARFLDPFHVEVVGPDDARTRVAAKQFVLATGSRPYRPPDVDFSHPCVLDADTVLRLDRTPQNLLVYGAGVVGCEYASMFRGLGIKVNLVNTRSKLLSFLDDEIIDALSYHLRDQGILVRHDEECERVEAVDDKSVVMHLKSGKQIKCDALLWANGRTGNSDQLDLKAVGLSADSRGNVSVDEHYRTQVPHIYAVGDLTGPPALASVAYDQGRFAARHIVDPASKHQLAKLIPTGIYTSPEISSIGPTERELTAAHVPYEVGRSPFKSLARAQITGQTVGMLKLLFDRNTLQILGLHCFGYQAAEIVHIGQAIMAQGGAGNTLDYFIDTTFNYPTMAEAYRVAALNGKNRLS
ncbi:MAG TPA: Si-specific NAD(P)(+) transhydrogenase [Myxococcales bacterium]